MDAANIAHRSGKAPTTTQLVRWEAKGFTVRWTTGGFLDWAGQRYTARDAVYGVLGDLPTFDDGIDNQTTRADITILPPSYEALAAMANPQHQGTLLQVWEADVDPLTGLLIGTPDPLFRGIVDFPRLVVGPQMELVIECGTEEALLNEPNQDRRLSNAFHQSVWPGELGLEYVTGLGRKIYWRVEGAGATAISSGGGYVGGGR